MESFEIVICTFAQRLRALSGGLLETLLPLQFNAFITSLWIEVALSVGK